MESLIEDYMFSDVNAVVGMSLFYNHGRGGQSPPPKFVGQTKPVGQYSLHSRAILAYYKNKWNKFCHFLGICQT
jgi:hypothetical protein